MSKEEFFYTEDHEWVARETEDGANKVGLSDYAQDQLGDIVFVEQPQVGDTFDQGEAFGVVESVKAVADVYLPVGGEVVEVNERLLTEPELINESPYEEGWLVAIEVADEEEFDELMTYEEYQDFLG